VATAFKVSTSPSSIKYNVINTHLFITFFCHPKKQVEKSGLSCVNEFLIETDGGGSIGGNYEKEHKGFSAQS
jgi:hypothetical protein